MLRTEGLTKQFGGLVAVDEVDFRLQRGELCSLIGPNGAGKTTFFDLLTGNLEPTAGTVSLRVDGEWQNITDADPSSIASRGIHRSYQVTNIFPQMAVLENVRIAVQAHGPNSFKIWRNAEAFDTHIEEARDIIRRVGLSSASDTAAAALSHGEKRRLEIAIALAGDPDILLLDEPNAGVSSENVGSVIDLIQNVAEDHTVLLVEHNMDIVMEVSERITVLHQGEIIADGDPGSIRSNEDVQEAYLGGYEGAA